MPRPIHRLIRAVNALVLVAGCHGASMAVDWWDISPANNRVLLDDSGSPTAIGLTVTTGAAPAIFPLAGRFHENYWSAPLPAPDTLTNNFTLPTIDLLVTPDAGSVAYSISLSNPMLPGAWLAVGNLSPAATVAIVPLDAGNNPLPGLTVLTTATWDAGFQPFDAPLLINGDNTLLTASPANTAQSGFVFLQLPSTGVASLRLDLSNPAAPLPGDLFSFSLGTPIPEPATTVLTLLASLPLFHRRRSSTT